MAAWEREVAGHIWDSYGLLGLYILNVAFLYIFFARAHICLLHKSIVWQVCAFLV